MFHVLDNACNLSTHQGHALKEEISFSELLIVFSHVESDVHEGTEQMHKNFWNGQK